MLKAQDGPARTGSTASCADLSHQRWRTLPRRVRRPPLSLVRIPLTVYIESGHIDRLHARTFLWAAALQPRDHPIKTIVSSLEYKPDSEMSLISLH